MTEELPEEKKSEAEVNEVKKETIKEKVVPVKEPVVEVPIEPGKICTLLIKEGFNCKPLKNAVDGIETIEVPSNELIDLSKKIKSREDLCFDFLISVSAVDKKDYFESVYHLTSHRHYHRLVMKVKVPKEEGKTSVPSVTSIWSGANWHERESYDLMGITYEGHPNLTRILNPSDWMGFPLRKDYKNEDPRLAWNER